MQCKALRFWKAINDDWLNKATSFSHTEMPYTKMDDFIEHSNVFFGRDGGDLYEAIHNQVYSDLKQDYNDIELATMLNLTIPSELQFDDDGYLIYDEEGTYDAKYWEYVDGHLNDALTNIQIAYDVGGKSAIDELKQIEPFNHINNKIYDFFLSQPTNAYMENQLYKGGSIMFFEDLSKINDEDSLSVYWEENWMYVNDESDNQAIATDISLYNAYRFATLINADVFDYTANDEEVKQLGEELLTLVDSEFCKINIWEYFDDISKDFKALTGRELGIDQKRSIVSFMTEMNDTVNAVHIGGSATFIAKMLWNYIKGNEKANIPRCDNLPINLLADDYLKSDDYDLTEFAKMLHHTAHNIKKTVEIRGALWINSAKYEYVDKIIITAEEVEIMNNRKQIGSILRENINTIEEQCVDFDTITDLKDELEFDITKVGDF